MFFLILLHKSLILYFSDSIIYLFAVVNKLLLICSLYSTLFMGSVGSVFLSQFGWHSVFIFHGLVALLWAYLWRFHIVLPEQLQKREQFALGNIKMVEASSSERAHMLNVPWGVFSKHPAVWYVFCYYVFYLKCWALNKWQVKINAGSIHLKCQAFILSQQLFEVVLLFESQILWTIAVCQFNLLCSFYF